MKSLLNAVKDQLENALSYSPSIFITPDEETLPASATFPAVGIKDGYQTVENRLGGTVKDVLTVIVTVAVKHTEASHLLVTGDETGKGVVEIASDVINVLHGNIPDISGIQEARLSFANPGELSVNDAQTEYIQRKRLTFTYEREMEI